MRDHLERNVANFINESLLQPLWLMFFNSMINLSLTCSKSSSQSKKSSTSFISFSEKGTLILFSTFNDWCFLKGFSSICFDFSKKLKYDFKELIFLLIDLFEILLSTKLMIQLLIILYGTVEISFISNSLSQNS